MHLDMTNKIHGIAYTKKTHTGTHIKWNV